MRPNILLITADDMNYDALGVTGCKVENITPNLDNLAKKGLRFVHAHVTVAVCQPSREVLMTGRYPHRNGAPGFDPINEDVPTLQEQLKQAGYINGIIGKVEHLMPESKFCWDSAVHTFKEENGLGREPKKYYQFAKEFFDKATAEEKPFFLMANSHDPHRPFVGSEQEKNKFGYNTTASRYYKSEEVEVPGFIPDIPGVRKEIAEYYSSVHRCDETVGEVLRALKESGFENNTLVMFLSDNGMAFPFAKTNCYLNSTRTPWIFSWPGVIELGVVDSEHMISGVDFMPTILDAVGLPQTKGMDGSSLMPLLKGEKQDERDMVFTVFNTTSAKNAYPMRCLQNKQFGYIFNAWSDQQRVFRNESQSGLTYRAMKEAANIDKNIEARVRMFDYRVREEFYDFQKDPDGLNNLINDPYYKDKINKMKKELLQKMVDSNDPLAETFKEEIDS